MLKLLRETLAGQRCLLCNKPRGLRAISVCLRCLDKLPPPKRIARNAFVVFTDEIEIPPDLVPAIAASCFYMLGGKTDWVLQKEDGGLSSGVAWHLRVPLVEEPHPHTLVVDLRWKNARLLDSLQYLFVFI